MLESEAARRVSLTRFVSHVNSHWHHDSCVQPSRKRDKEFMKHKHSGYVLLSGSRSTPFGVAPYRFFHFRGRAGGPHRTAGTSLVFDLGC